MRNLVVLAAQNTTANNAEFILRKIHVDAFLDCQDGHIKDGETSATGLLKSDGESSMIDRWLFLGATVFLGIAGAVGLMLVLLLMMMLNPAIGRELVIASTYGDAKDIRRTGETRVATGAALDANGMTVAHKTLPFGTKLTMRRGHYSAVVTVNDRGPYIRGREFDLTPAVNKQLRCYGLCRVRTEPWPPLPKQRPNLEIAAQ